MMEIRKYSHVAGKLRCYAAHVYIIVKFYKETIAIGNCFMVLHTEMALIREYDCNKTN